MILGGTGDAANLARRINNQFSKTRVITSLAGRTQKPRRIAGQVIFGGFGGATGLQSFIETEKIQLVFDATHPFSQKISQNASIACEKAKVLRIILDRPQWELPRNGNWVAVENISAAAKSISSSVKRIFVTTGGNELNVFDQFKNTWFLIRLIEKPKSPIKIQNYKLVLSRPPFKFSNEKALLQNHDIDCLISKNSGGNGTKAKIKAALQLSIPIILIRRPPNLPGLKYNTVGQCIEWLKNRT